ncbi:MAG: hypothetical protein Q8Q14_00480 [Gemmatimonadales bacterium]|nr:hypothetical protein [Gemmatimonadales bacterium]
MRNVLLIGVLLAGCGDEGEADGCVPVEGGAPCCDQSFDVSPGDCPEGTTFEEACMMTRSGQTTRAPCDAPGAISASRACIGDDRKPHGPGVSYHPNGKVSAFWRSDEWQVSCHDNGLMMLRQRAVAVSVFERNGCFEACYDVQGAAVACHPGQPYCPDFGPPETPAP